MNANREGLLFGLTLTKPEAERAAWLDRECGDDTALRARLDILFDCAQMAEHILHSGGIRPIHDQSP